MNVCLGLVKLSYILVFWVMTPYSLVVLDFYPEDAGISTPETLLTKNQTAWCHDPEDYSLSLRSGSFRSRTETSFLGKDTQDVSRWLPNTAARVRSISRSCGIFGGQCGTGVGFLLVLR
jgi:hypothetical protein